MIRVLLLTLVLAERAQAPEPAAKPKVDGAEACALVTRSEAVAVLGGLRSEPRSETGLQQEHECHYVTEAGTRLSVRVYSSDRWQLQKGIVSEMEPEDIPGLGDEAFAVRRGSGSEVYVRRDKLMIEVSGSAGMTASRAMAEKAASRLPPSVSKEEQ